MSDLGLQYAALSGASATIAAMSDELTTAGHTLEARALGLLGSGWQGRAADAFRTGYEDWRQGADQVVAALREMGVLIDQANQRFQGTDLGVDAAMQALHSRLGGAGS